jgi:hypothetical protein
MSAVCSDCGQECGAEKFLTEVNPPGGYGLAQMLVCDECMTGEDWSDWRARMWPNWPNKPIDYDLIVEN